MRTRNLTQLLTSLLQQHHLLSANQLVELLAQQSHSYNKTSVYRALDRLLSEGKICQFVLDGKEAVYEVRHEHHDHAICQRCGSVSAVDCDEPEALIPNFKVDHHHTLIYGTCTNCQLANSVS